MKLLIFLAVFCCCVVENLGCSCELPEIDFSKPAAYLKYSVCRAEHAIRAWVTSGPKLPDGVPPLYPGQYYEGLVYYDIEIKEVFKPFSDKYKPSSGKALSMLGKLYGLKKQAKVFTWSTENLCGVRLQETTKEMKQEEHRTGVKAGLLLYGYGQRFSIGQCGYNPHFKSLSPEEISWLENPDCTPDNPAENTVVDTDVPLK